MRLDIELTPSSQLRARDLLVNALGAKLYRPAEDLADYSAHGNEPTPAKLAKKIILVVGGEARDAHRR